MRKNVFWSVVLICLCLTLNGFSQQESPVGKMSVNDRMAKARAAKAEKRTSAPLPPQTRSTNNSVKATSADYRAPVDKTQKGPHGEVVHTGERGGKFYINKNGNKTYLSSNL